MMPLKHMGLATILLLLSLTMLPVAAVKQPRPMQTSLTALGTYENTIVLVTPSNAILLNQLKAAFEKYAREKLGVNVEMQLIRAGSPECMNKIIAWAGTPEADIFFGGDLIYHWKLKARNLLEPYKPNSPYYDELPMTFLGSPLRDPDEIWHPKLWWGHGFMYNTQVLKSLNLDPPKTWDDLLDPKWKDLIVMCTPSRSSSTYINVVIILQNRGWDEGWAFWRKVASNIGSFVQRSHDVIELVSKGEYAIGFTYAQGVVINRQQGYPVSIYMDPTGFIVSGVSLIKGAPHSNIAKAFLDWWYTPDAQQAALEAGAFPVLPSLKIQGPPNSTAAILREYLGGKDNIYEYLESFTGVKFYNFTYAEMVYNDVSKLFDEDIVAKHADLKDAWSTILGTQNKVRGVSSAEAKLNDAISAFGRGDYSSAKSLALEAENIVTQEKARREMITNITIAVVIIIIIAVAVILVMRRKKPVKS
ncbi:MAG: extracellular solute-binding protein [Candidatus Jordarchaeales archaeon]